MTQKEDRQPLKHSLGNSKFMDSSRPRIHLNPTALGSIMGQNQARNDKAGLVILGMLQDLQSRQHDMSPTCMTQPASDNLWLTNLSVGSSS